MNYRLLLGIVIGLVIGASLMAGAPVINENLSSSTTKGVRLMDPLRLSVWASDPQNHPLMYEWSITQDPTNLVYFKPDPTHKTTTVMGSGTMELGFPWISSSDAANQPFVGQTVQVVLVVKHANAADGTETVSRTFTITITGINHPPVPKITGQMGTPTDRIEAGKGVICSAGESTDVDQHDSFAADWALGTTSGGSYKNGVTPQIFGGEGTSMSFTVPDMTANIDQQVVLQLSDGLHQVRTSAIAYLKPRSSVTPPPTTNGAPNVTVTTPLSKKVGETLILNGVVTDNEGDDCQFSWVWLQTGQTVSSSAVTVTPVAVAAPAKKWNVSANLGVIPPPAGTFQARLTATEKFTTAKKSDAEIVTIYVTEDGGNPPPEQPIQTTTNCQTGNNPPSVSINPNPFTTALQYTGGQTVNIVVTAQDSSIFQSPLGPKSGAVITWDLSQLGFTVTPVNTSNATTNTATSTLTFTAPQANRTAVVTVTAADQLGCSIATQFPIVFQSSTANQPPDAVIKYKIGNGTLQNAPATPVAIDAPATITLDASGSTDDGGSAALTYLWTPAQNLLGVSLANPNSKTATVSVASGTVGNVTFNLKVTDQPGLNDTASITFNIGGTTAKPTANVAVKSGTAVLTSAVEEGTIITLDGSGSTAVDGSKNNLTFEWRQLDGPPVSLIGLDSDKATFVAPGVNVDGTALKFELTVTDTQTNSSAQKQATVTVNIGATYFAQVGFGPLGENQLRSVLLLVNNTDQSANGVTVEFFGPDGQELEALIDGQPWTNEPFNIPAGAAKRLEFSGAGDQAKIGWARVKSGTKLTGLIRYQVVGSDGEKETVESEISVFSSIRGRNFATYLSATEEMGLAIANPTDQPVGVKVKLISVTGEVLRETLLLGSVVGSLFPKLEAKQHRAEFVKLNDWFGQLPGFKEGTLVLEAESEIVVTVIKTRQGVIFSASPLAASK